MRQIIYVSTTNNSPSESDLLDLLVKARHRNLKNNITGMLLYSNNTFLQVIEGNEKAVTELYEAIRKDPRNEGHVILREIDIPVRDFPDWSMGFENLERHSPNEIPGYIEVFGGRLNKTIAENNRTNAIKLLMSFSKN